MFTVSCSGCSKSICISDVEVKDAVYCSELCTIISSSKVSKPGVDGLDSAHPSYNPGVEVAVEAPII